MRKTITAMTLVAFGATMTPSAAQATILADPKVSWSDRSCHKGTLKVTGKGTAETEVTFYVKGSRDVIDVVQVGPSQTEEVRVGCANKVNVSSKSAGVDLGVKVKKRHWRR